MANRYWVGGTANWDATAGTKWALTSGGPGGASVPTSSDDVYFDNNSGNGTVTTNYNSPTCHSLICTGFTGTLTGVYDIFLYGDLVLGSGMNNGVSFYFSSTSSVNTITSNGKDLNHINFNGVGGTWKLLDNLSVVSDINIPSYISLNYGTFDANGKNVTCNTFSSSNSNTRTLIMGSGTWTINCPNAANAWYIATSTGLTLDPGTSTIIINYTGGNNYCYFFGGGKTYYNIHFTNANAIHSFKVGDSNTFNNFIVDPSVTLNFYNGITTTVNSFIAVGTSSNGITLDVYPSAGGSNWILNCTSGIINCDYLSLYKSTATGGASFYAGSHSTNGTGNSGWTFTSAPGKYWVGGTANWDATAGTKWALTNGGVGGQPIPTSSDNVYFNANSGNVTVTVPNTVFCKNLDFTGFTGTFTGSINSLDIYGSLILDPGMTNSYTGAWYFTPTSGNFTIASNSVPFLGQIVFHNTPGTTYKLLDNISTTNLIVQQDGTFDANNYNVTCYGYYSPYTNTRVLNMGSGTWNITGSSTTLCWNIINTNLTLNPSTSTIKFTSPYTNNVTFIGGGLTYYNIWFARTISNGIITIQGSNTFNNFKDDGTNYHTIAFTDGTTTNISSLTINGYLGRYITLTGTSTAGWIIRKTTGIITVDTTLIQYSTATGGATFNANNSLNLGSNSGWNFTSPLVPSISDSINIIETVTVEKNPKRFWVGGDGNWDQNTTTHWSTTSGGPGGASVPNGNYDVFIDGNSGGGIITQTYQIICKSLDFTGFTGTFNATSGSGDFDITLYGDLTLGSGMTFLDTANDANISFLNSGIITSNGVVMPCDISVSTYGIVSLADDLNLSFRSLYLNTGTFDANNYNVSIDGFFQNGGLSGTTLYMGSGLWNITGHDPHTWWVYSPQYFTVYPGTSTIKFTDNSSNYKTFYGGNKTYYNFWNATQGNGFLLVDGSNTFNNFKIDAGRTQYFNEDSYTTINSIDWNGTIGNPITLNGRIVPNDNTPVLWHIVDTTGTNIVTYCNISYSDATGGATWNAIDPSNIDGGNNTGWEFSVLNVNVSDNLNITENLNENKVLNIHTFDIVNVTDNKNLISSYGEVNSDGTGYYLDTGDGTFFVGHSFSNINQQILNSCKFYMGRAANSAIGNLYAQIYAHTGVFGVSGHPTGSPLSISDAVDISSLPIGTSNNPKIISFNFSGINRITLNASTNYCLVITSDVDNTNVEVMTDSANITASGNDFISVNGTTWQISGIDYDLASLIFYVYGEYLTNVVEPGTLNIQTNDTLNITEDYRIYFDVFSIVVSDNLNITENILSKGGNININVYDDVNIKEFNLCILPTRYWVGGTGTWDASTTTHWSTTSGGSGGAAVPTSSDTVIFDNNSGGGTINLGTGATTLNLNFTGFTGTLTGGNNIVIFGSLIMGSGMTNNSTISFIMFANSGIQTIITNGIPLYYLTLGGIIVTGGTYQLQDNLTVLSNLYFTGGTFNTNNYNITCESLVSTNTTNRTLNMGSGLWTITGYGTVWDCSISTNLTINPSTSIIKISNTAYQEKIFDGGSLTYYNIWNATSLSTALLIYGDNTFNDIKIDPYCTLLLDDGSIQIINSLTAYEPIYGQATIGTINSSSPATLSKSSGVVTVAYCKISNSTATGGATFYDVNGIDNGGNTGWFFVTETDVDIYYENISITEDLNLNISNGGINISSNINITENVNIDNKNNITTSDSITITENLNINLQDININIFDNIITTEDISISNPQLGNINVRDLINVIESIIIVTPQLGGINRFDSIITTENINISNPLTDINLSDNINITENVLITNTQLSNISTSDNVNLTENINLSNPQLGDINIFDNLKIVDGKNIDSYSENLVNDYTKVVYSLFNYVGTRFTNINPSTLSSARFYLKKVGVISGNAVVKIFALSGGLPIGSALATSDNFDVSILTTTAQLITFNFSGVNQIVLTSQQYAVVIYYTGGSNSNWIMFGDRIVGGNGNELESANGSSWFNATPFNIAFYVNSTTGLIVNEIDFSINVYDSINISENLVVNEVNLKINIFDIISILEDIQTNNITSGDISVIDNINISENLGRSESAYLLSLFDGVNITENINTRILQLGGINIYDLINIIEDFSINASGAGDSSIFSNINISENINTIISQLGDINVYDLINTTENLGESGSGLLNVYDSLSISEDITSQSSLGDINKFENINVTSVLVTITRSAPSTMPAVAFDNITITDSVNVLIPRYFIKINEPIEISEDLTSFITLGDVHVFDVVFVQEPSLPYDDPDYTYDDENLQYDGYFLEVEILDDITIDIDFVYISEFVQISMSRLGDIDVFDIIYITENLGESAEFSISVNDLINISDVVNFESTEGDIIVSDNILITDILIEGITVGDIFVFDNIIINENLNETSLVSFSTSDNINITDVVSLQPIDIYIDVSDNIIIAEYSNVLLSVTINVFDDIIITENIQLSINSDINVFDTINITENINTQSVLTMSVFDNIHITENLKTVTSIDLSVYNIINITEHINTERIISMNVYDNIIITEYINTESFKFAPSVLRPVGEMRTIGTPEGKMIAPGGLSGQIKVSRMVGRIT